MSKSRCGAVGLAALLAVSLSGATLAQDEAVEISYLTHWGPDQVAQHALVADDFCVVLGIDPTGHTLGQADEIFVAADLLELIASLQFVVHDDQVHRLAAVVQVDEGLEHEAVVGAVRVPVTLKIRTGWDRRRRNGIRIARIAEECGVAALSVHGRTRADRFAGEAEYRTIRRIKASVGIPVLANGDIDSPAKAASVMAVTGADGLLIGRAAQGRPWIFREVSHYLQNGTEIAPPTAVEVRDIMLAHLDSLYSFYGEFTGVRVARKHLSWYCRSRTGAEAFRHSAVRAESAAEQLRLVREFFDQTPSEELAA